MADTTVFLTGIAPGVVAQGFSELPPWASEKTAMAIERHLKKSSTSLSQILTEIKKCCAASGTGTMSPEDLKKFNEEIKKAGKGLKRENDEEPKRKKRNKEEEENHKHSLKAWKDQLWSLAAFATIITKTGDQIKQAMEENVDTFDELYSSGINVMDGFNNAASGFEALQQLTQITGVRFTELSATIIKYNTAINSLGLERFARTINVTSKSLAEVGYNAKQTGELLGAYLESQRGYNDVNAKTQAQLNKDLISFGTRMTRLSQATGMVRAELIKEVEAISQSVEANLLAGQIGGDAAGSMVEFIATFKDKNLGQQFLKMMTDTIKPLNTTFMDFQKTGFGGFGQKLMNFTKSLEGLKPEEAAERTAAFAKANAQEINMMKQRGNLLSQAGNREADSMLKTVVALEQQGRNYKKVSDGDKKKADATAESTKKFQNELERLRSAWQAAFAPTIPMLNLLTDGLKAANSAVDLFVKGLSSSTRAYMGAAIVTAGFILSLAAVKKGLDMFEWHLRGGVDQISKSTTKSGGKIADAGDKAGKSIAKSGRGLSGAMGKLGSAMGVLAKGAGMAGAAIVGWQIGQDIGNNIVNPLLDGLVKKITGNENDTLGTGLYSLFNSDKEKEIADMMKGSGPAPATKPGEKPKETKPGDKEKQEKEKKDKEKEKPKDVKDMKGVAVDPKTGTPIAAVNPPPSSSVNLPKPSPKEDEEGAEDKEEANTAAESKEETEQERKDKAKPPPPPSSTDINSLLTYQSKILVDIFEANVALVSLNKDILKYTKHKA